MKKLRIILAFFLLAVLMPIKSQDSIPVWRLETFEKYLNRQTDTLYVINFWATWCGPCRKELPEFEKIHQNYASQKVKVLLVSLDFPNQLEKTLIPFIRTHHISAPVVLLNEPDADRWIDKVDPAWTGSLPATLFYRGKNRHFLEKELTYADINQLIINQLAD
ncbi:MAG: redoxin domain-containing protein [Bacteroidales bacterium]|nr:redoxin domain-containing protein [Bacteroidales bacterium]